MTEALKFGLPQGVIKAIKEVLGSYAYVERVIIYGSRAMGNYKQGSDIDLCLEGKNLTVKDLLKIETELDDLLLPWKIDLSVKYMIDNPKLLAHIERVGTEI